MSKKPTFIFTRIFKLVFSLCILIGFSNCHSGKNVGPNIRKVKLELPVSHFENDFFKLDTNNLVSGLDSLKVKYGYFYTDYMYNIAAFSMEDETFYIQIKHFIRTNRQIYDSVSYYIPHLDKQLHELENAIKRAKVYFPELSMPPRIITYIGPIDGYGSFASKEGLAVGLQQFFGTQYTGYQNQQDYLESLFGSQRLKQFTPDYIAPAAITSWINRTFPDKSGHYTLADKLIEEGRKIYVLKALLPELSDSAIFGYTGEQMKWCNNNSILIKRYFEHENLLKTKNPEKIVTYLSDNLRPDSLPEAFPNNIGKYLGFLMVRDYMVDHKKITLPHLMELELWNVK